MSPRPLVTATLLLACLVALPAIAATANAPLSAHALATAAKLRDTGMAGSQAYALAHAAQLNQYQLGVESDFRRGPHLCAACRRERCGVAAD